MKFSYGLGIVLIVLIAVILALFGLSLFGVISTFLFLSGAWTIFAAFSLVKRNERYYYLGWGVILVSLSTIYSIPWQYSIAIALILVIVVVLLSRYRP